MELYPSRAEVKYAIARAWQKDSDYANIMRAVDELFDECAERFSASEEARLAFVASLARAAE
jgi:hypothetical protein